MNEQTFIYINTEYSDLKRRENAYTQQIERSMRNNS